MNRILLFSFFVMFGITIISSDDRQVSIYNTSSIIVFGANSYLLYKNPDNKLGLISCQEKLSGQKRENAIKNYTIDLIDMPIENLRLIERNHNANNTIYMAKVKDSMSKQKQTDENQLPDFLVWVHTRDLDNYQYQDGISALSLTSFAYRYNKLNTADALKKTSFSRPLSSSQNVVSHNRSESIAERRKQALSILSSLSR